MTTAITRIKSDSTAESPGRSERREKGVLLDFTSPHEYVDIGHSQLAYWCAGEGPDLVLVHGWPLHSATYRHLLPSLTRHYRCHLFDLPGSGMTRTQADAPFGIRAHGASLFKGIQAKGLEKYSLLGHDSGAAIMQFAAAEDSANVRCLIMGNTETPGYHSALMKLLMVIARIPRGPQLFFRMLQVRAFRQSRLALGGCFSNPVSAEGSFHQWFIEPLISKPAVREQQAKLLANFSADDIAALIDIQCRNTLPVQLLWGAQDRYFLLEDARRMQQRFKGPSEIRVNDHGKLFVHEDHAEWFATQALDFLARYAQ